MFSIAKYSEFLIYDNDCSLLRSTNSIRIPRIVRLERILLELWYILETSQI